MSTPATRLFLLPCLLSSIAACAHRPTAEPVKVEAQEDAIAARLRRQAPRRQLPADVRPERYRVSLRIDATQTRFQGKVAIDLQVLRPTRIIWLHGLRLRVQEVSLQRGEQQPLKLLWRDVDAQLGLAALVLEQPLTPGTATLRFVYDAAFDQRLQGLYRVEEGSDAYAFTQMEPTAARLVFPSFDEPRHKAIFELDLTIPNGHQAVANAPLLRVEKQADGFKHLTFAPTPPLSTYLVAFATGPLQIVAASPLPRTTQRTLEVPLRGIATRHRGGQLTTLLRQIPGLLGQLEEYFGSAYPYAKLDALAVPDFAAGAMENAGLIAYRESIALLDEKSSEEQRRFLAYVTAHELAHQWFGNWVTMAWWDDLWLNEAFATWMGHKAVQALYPEHHSEMTQVSRAQWTMHLDSLASARRIRQPVNGPHGIRNAFDPITYEKGGAVLRMFEHWLGADAFRQGVRTYLQQHAEKTATTDDFLAALSQAAGRDAAAPMRSFLEQTGVPLLDIEPTCVEGKTKLHVSQHPYQLLNISPQAARTWQVPMCIRYGQAGRHALPAQEHCHLLRQATEEIELPPSTERRDEKRSADKRGNRCAAWLLPNAAAAGYYRFTLPVGHLQALRDAAWPHLQATEKLAVVDSLRAAFDSARLAASDLFGWVKGLSQDALRPINIAPMDWLAFADDYLLTAAEQSKLRRWAAQLYAPWLAKLRWSAPAGGKTENGEVQLQRQQVIDFLALQALDPAVRQRAAQLGRSLIGFDDDHRLHLERVAPEMIETALAVAVQESDGSFFAELKGHLWQAEPSWLRLHMLRALAHSEVPALAAEASQLALNPLLPQAEILVPLQRQMLYPTTRRLAWPWLEKHLPALRRRISAKRAGDLPWLAAGFCTASEATRVEKLFEPTIDRLAGGPRNLAAVLETIRSCERRVQTHRASATAWVQELR